MLLSVQAPAVLNASEPHWETDAQVALEKSVTLRHASLLVSLTAVPRSAAASFTLAQSASMGVEASANVVANTRNRIFMGSPPSVMS